MVKLDVMNGWSQADAAAQFLRCCGARQWAEQMAARRPFADERELFAAAEEVWRSLTPADWLEASFKAAARINDRRQYGYHWYVGNISTGPRRGMRWMAAMGNGGQRLAVFPELELVLVVTAGSYNRRSYADDLIGDVVLPSLQ